MKSILVFGAGKSATCLIEYLVNECSQQQWQLTVADGNLELAKSKIGSSPNAKAVEADVLDAASRADLIEAADIVISLLPPHLHILVASDCVTIGRNLLTASYADAPMRELEDEIKNKNLLFLCEMGLDPGIDHMSAMQIIHRIAKEGGKITSFKSHCGGLVSPESDDNPWHYKISWNPRNIVQAGMAGATYKESGITQSLPYEMLFDSGRVVDIPELGYLSWYPNRDSLAYMTLYDLEEATTFVRTTLRYPEFCFGWKNIIELKLTDETIQYDTDGMTLQQFFQLHFNQYGFSTWLEKQLTDRFSKTKQLLEKLQQLLEVEQGVGDAEKKELQDFMMVDDNGELMDINLDAVKTKAAATVAGQMHEANLAMKQLFFLGMDDTETTIDKGMCSALDVLQFAIEKKLALNPDDKDMIVMLHEFEYVKNGKPHSLTSSLVVKGKDNLRTAMAQTVGMPLGIAAKLILTGKITAMGLHIPVLPEIYEPVLEELEKAGIKFTEKEV
ncbi:MAG: saccharopine dehydrogenase NADP-binding domain-containing protein [Chitinophagaceae bacterium]|nr:saccharopine dehydrogenase NADP-binding domain-containing protein [Chitinophagaceae bacterium]